MTYILVICAAISWAGCGASVRVAYPSEEACARALREMRTEGPSTAGHDKRRSMFAFCRPAEKGEK